MSEESIVIERKEKPNSHEFGKPGNRFKLYFDTAEDLNNQIRELESFKLISKD